MVVDQMFSFLRIGRASSRSQMPAGRVDNLRIFGNRRSNRLLPRFNSKWGLLHTEAYRELVWLWYTHFEPRRCYGAGVFCGDCICVEELTQVFVCNESDHKQTIPYVGHNSLTPSSRLHGRFSCVAQTKITLTINIVLAVSFICFLSPFCLEIIHFRLQ